AVGSRADRGDRPHPRDHDSALSVPHLPPPSLNAECGMWSAEYHGERRADQPATRARPSTAIPHSALRIPHLPESPHVPSANRLMPARVRDAIPWMNTGPITRRAATGPTSGHAGPVHSCTIVTATPSDSPTSRQTTSIPVVVPRTCR